MQIRKEFVWRRDLPEDDPAFLAKVLAQFGSTAASHRAWLGGAFKHLLGIDAATDPIEVVDVAVLPRLRGTYRIYFRVGSLEQAELLVRRRCALRGWGDLLMEVLTPVEREHRRRLWPAFEAAQEAGRQAQFVRSRLYVDGKELASPSSL
jgi:hypothetical protein